MSVMWVRKGGREYIKPTKIAYPIKTEKLKHTNNGYSPIWNGYDENTMTMAGANYATDVGTYQTTFKPKDGYCWIDGTTEAFSVYWDIYSNIWYAYAATGVVNVYKENFEFTFLNTDKYWVGETYGFVGKPNSSRAYFTIPNGTMKYATSLGTKKYFLTNGNNQENVYHIMGYIKSKLENTNENQTRYRYDLYEIESVNKTGDMLYAVTSNDVSAYPENFLHTDGQWYVLQT